MLDTLNRTSLYLASLARRGLLIAGAASLASCGGPYPAAQLPVSGISGADGGADAAIYYDSGGNAHFRN